MNKSYKDKTFKEKYKIKTDDGHFYFDSTQIFLDGKKIIQKIENMTLKERKNLYSKIRKVYNLDKNDYPKIMKVYGYLGTLIKELKERKSYSLAFNAIINIWDSIEKVKSKEFEIKSLKKEKV